MTEPSRALVEAAKRVLLATRAEHAAWAAYTEARRERERAQKDGPVWLAPFDIARAELAAESAQPSGGPK